MNFLKFGKSNGMKTRSENSKTTSRAAFTKYLLEPLTALSFACGSERPIVNITVEPASLNPTSRPDGGAG